MTLMLARMCFVDSVFEVQVVFTVYVSSFRKVTTVEDMGEEISHKQSLS